MTQQPQQQPLGGNQSGYLPDEAPGEKIARNWLGTLGIHDKEWSYESRLLLKRGQKARCLGGAGRVFCCLKLHTEAYQSELAVQSVAGKIVPLRPSDVASFTGLPKQHIRRYMLQLKAWGMGDIVGEQHHNIRLYLWMVPHPVDAEAVVATDPWTSVPKELRKWFRRFRVLPDAGFDFANQYLLDLDDAINGYLRSLEVVKSVLSRSHSGPAIQKREKRSEKESAGQSVGPVRVTDRRAAPDDAEQVSEFLITELGDILLGEGPTRTLCLQIASAAGPMPLEYALPLIRRKRRKIQSMGMVLPLIKESRSRWERDASKRQRLVDQQNWRDRCMAEEVLKNPDASEEDRAWAKAVLE